MEASPTLIQPCRQLPIQFQLFLLQPHQHCHIIFLFRFHNPALDLPFATVNLYPMPQSLQRARKQLFSLPDGNGVDTAAFSPDGTYLVTGSDTGSATIWNWRSNAPGGARSSALTWRGIYLN